MLDGDRVSENKIIKFGNLMYIEFQHIKHLDGSAACGNKFHTTTLAKSPNLNRFDL